MCSVSLSHTLLLACLPSSEVPVERAGSSEDGEAVCEGNTFLPCLQPDAFSRKQED